jgi:hypothetical protein
MKGMTMATTKEEIDAGWETARLLREISVNAPTEIADPTNSFANMFEGVLRWAGSEMGLTPNPQEQSEEDEDVEPLGYEDYRSNCFGESMYGDAQWRNEDFLNSYFSNHVVMLPDGSIECRPQIVVAEGYEEYSGLLASRLAAAIERGDLDMDSVLKLIEQAHLERLNGNEYSSAAAALYALAFADAQGANWREFEDYNIEEPTYLGEDGVWIEHNTDQGSGNCAMFISMVLLAGGAQESTLWNLNDVPDPLHDDHRTNPQHPQYCSGTDMFRGAPNLLDRIILYGPLNVDVGRPHWDIRDTPTYDETLQNIEDQQGQHIGVGVGDLIFSYDIGGPFDHVAIVVGWGPPANLDASVAGTAFCPTLEAAQADGITEEELENWVPYIVDHGGDHTQSYPRPWQEGVSDHVWKDQSDYIALVSVEPKE